jgi:hypothetical protein
VTAALFDDGSRWATVSDDGLYRYDLGRRWADGPLLGFVMLNPSTGDAEVDDPTLRRCIGFAQREGLAGIVVRNLYAFRSPSPKDLKAADKAGVDIVGPENDRWLRDLAAARFEVRTVVAAWGAGVKLPSPVSMSDRRRFVVDIFGGRLHHFALPHRPGDGNVPALPTPHPLYLRSDTPLASYPAPVPAHLEGQ